MRKLLILLLVWLTGCTTDLPAQRAVTLRVFAAASLSGAFSELGAGFAAAHPGVTVEFNFAGSQQLAQQLAQGAPADVFASANQRQLEAVAGAGRALAEDARVFAHNRLIVIYPKGSARPLTTLADLAQPGLRVVLAASEVPVGQYAREFLDKASAGELGPDYAGTVLANVVSYEENVKAVFTKVALGEADAGIVYSSDVTGADAERVEVLEIPDAFNVIAAYPLVALTDAHQPALAAEFVAFVLSAEGQAVLQGYGLLPAGAP